jgi:hypothetical protein
MFKVYFDGIEQNEKDIININDVAEFTIIREDGFSSDEQILRDKTEMDLQFCGGAYSYICNKIATDRCNEIEFRIEDDETLLYYNGIIPVLLCELDLTRRTGKTKIKDNSFSAFIRDFIDVDVRLFNTKSKECVSIESTFDIYVLKSTFNNDVDTKTVNGFDALKVIQYLVAYFTDNTIDVVSTFLTTNKYLITTGYNMHSFGVSADEIYPEISIQKLFDELRKKLRLYMGIEYDVANRPYLRIEQESYFFSNTVPLFNIDEIPHGTIQTYDINRNFNAINVGSTTVDVQDGGSTPYPQESYTAWNDETYVGCGTCTGLKDSSLELVSDYIIDSNLIYEALNWGASDYANDESIFLINYTTSAGSNISVRTLQSGEYFYNDTLINENIISNWIDEAGDCIALQRQSKYGFKLLYPNYPPQINTAVTQCCGADNINYNTILYDNLNSIYSGSRTQTQCTPISYADLFKGFECQENGEYNFIARAIGLRQGNNPNYELIDVEYTLTMNVYTDNTLATLIDSYVATDTQDGYTVVNLNIETELIPLSVGNCVMTEFFISRCPVVNPTNIVFDSEYASFESNRDSFGCENIPFTDQDTKPFVLNFEYPLCFSDYQTAKENKRGYIDITGKRYWIKELIYRHNRNSSLKLMGNYSLCGC